MTAALTSPASIETLDCGEDTGTLDRVAVRLGEERLTAGEQRQFDEIRGRGVMAK